MKRVFAVGLALILLQLGVLAQSVEQLVELRTGDGVILRGTLLLPSLEQDNPIAVALIVSGSGPTDRDGNSPYMLNNSLKMVAEELMKQGIASLRYDKRGVRASAVPAFDESKITLDSYAKDVENLVRYLNRDARFDDIILIGHSEGASLAMRAIANGADANQLILLAGAGRPMQKILREQLATQPQQIKDISYAIIDTLESGRMYNGVPLFLNSLFRPSIQPALIEEFKVEPTELAASIKVPMLIVQGTTDIQISQQDAKKLSSANKSAELYIIENMNHVLKECEVMDKDAQMQYYTNPLLPLHYNLMPKIIEFIEKNIE